jgi:hypothetical protein
MTLKISVYSITELDMMPVVVPNPLTETAMAEMRVGSMIVFRSPVLAREILICELAIETRYTSLKDR